MISKICGREIGQEFWQNFDEIISKTLVPSYSSEAVRPCAAEDYSCYREVLTENLQKIIPYIDVLTQKEEWKTTEIRLELIKVIVIIGEQSSENVWNTSKALDVLELLVSRVCILFSIQNLTQVLSNDVFSAIITYLRPKLMKSSWKSHPAAVVCYAWLLQSVKKPFLRHHISDVIPTALIILDDYDTLNQKVGLNCLSIIIQHCHNSHSLRNLNYDEVIFDALERMGHKFESNVILDLYTCMSNLLAIIHFCDSTSYRYSWSKHDNVMMVLLSNMELQTNHQSRLSFAVSLKKLLIHFNVGKWSERLAGIIAEYCEDVNDLKTVDASLDLLHVFLSIYQPIGQHFAIAVFASLIKLCCKIETNRICNVELIQKVNSAISVLNNIYPSIGTEIKSNPVIMSIVQSALSVNTGGEQ